MIVRARPVGASGGRRRPKNHPTRKWEPTDDENTAWRRPGHVSPPRRPTCACPRSRSGPSGSYATGADTYRSLPSLTRRWVGPSTDWDTCAASQASWPIRRTISPRAASRWPRTWRGCSSRRSTTPCETCRRPTVGPDRPWPCGLGISRPRRIWTDSWWLGRPQYGGANRPGGRRDNKRAFCTSGRTRAATRAQRGATTRRARPAGLWRIPAGTTGRPASARRTGDTAGRV